MEWNEDLRGPRPRYDSCWTSIDPGVKYYAWANWEGCFYPVLTDTGINLYESVAGTQPWFAAIERPRIMPGRKVRAKDVEGVLIGYGKLTRIYPNHKDYYPHSVPEKIWHKRILGLLSDEERAIVMLRPASERKHTIDAVGIGLKHLGRLK